MYTSDIVVNTDTDCISYVHLIQLGRCSLVRCLVGSTSPPNGDRRTSASDSLTPDNIGVISNDPSQSAATAAASLTTQFSFLLLVLDLYEDTMAPCIEA